MPVSVSGTNLVFRGIGEGEKDHLKFIYLNTGPDKGGNVQYRYSENTPPTHTVTDCLTNPTVVPNTIYFGASDKKVSRIRLNWTNIRTDSETGKYELSEDPDARIVLSEDLGRLYFICQNGPTGWDLRSLDKDLQTSSERVWRPETGFIRPWSNPFVEDRTGNAIWVVGEIDIVGQ